MSSRIDVPAPLGLSKCRTNLPAQPTRLIGRALELKAACAYLCADVRLLTLDGPPGVGKTRLALEIAAELLGRFAEGVYLVELAAIHDPGLVLPTIAQVLGVADERGQPLITTLAEYLRGRRILLVLDNFEQVIDAAPLLADLLTAAPSLALMVTSRAALRVYGEQEFPVPPLELPDPERLPPLSLLDRNEAIALFVARAQQVKPDFQLIGENARAVAEICQRLDGLPLAIELAAARIKILSPSALLARLNDRLGLLSGGARERALRQQTLRDAIAWSYDLLDPAEQALFARHAVFVGGATIEAIEAVCGNWDSAVLSSILDDLASLVDKNLLRRIEASDGSSRLSMLETIREYAVGRLISRAEVTSVHERHAAYFLQLAEQAEPELTAAAQATWLERLERDHDNLRAAIQWSIDQKRVDIAARMVGALWRFWYTRGHLSEGRRWLARALTLVASTQGAADGDDAQSRLDQQPIAAMKSEIQAKLLTGAGVMAWAQGAFAQAYQHYEDALSLMRGQNNRLEEALTLDRLGTVALHQGDDTRAEALYTESLALLHTLEYTWGIANSLSNLAMVAQLQGDPAKALTLYSRSLELRRELGDRRGIAIALNNLAEVMLQQGDAAQAHALYVESLMLCNELGDKDGLAYSLEGLADVAAAHDQTARAVRLLGAAAMLRDSFGVPMAPFDRVRRAACLAHLQTCCDDETWTASWSVGQTLTLDQTIAEALAQA